MKIQCSATPTAMILRHLSVTIKPAINDKRNQIAKTYHLKLDYFFGAHHCAYFLLAIRSSEKTFIVCRLKGLRLAFPGHWLGPPVIWRTKYREPMTTKCFAGLCTETARLFRFSNLLSYWKKWTENYRLPNINEPLIPKIFKAFLVVQFFFFPCHAGMTHVWSTVNTMRLY